MKGFRDHGGLLESVVILFIMLVTFGVPEPTKAVSDDSQVSYDVASIDVEADSLDGIEKIETGEIAGDFKRTYVPRNVVMIMGRTIGLSYVSLAPTGNGTYYLPVPSNGVGKYGRLYMGHNTSSILLGIDSLPVGSTFSVYEGEQQHVYRVVGSQIVTKSSLNGTINGMSRGSFNGSQYSAIFMTCAGTPLGNGDATHRALMFANEI